MGKKSPPDTCEGKNQTTMFNFFTKKEKQQSKLFTHTTRPRAAVLTKPILGGKRGGVDSCNAKPLRKECGKRGSVLTEQLVGDQRAGEGNEENRLPGSKAQKEASHRHSQNTRLEGSKSLTPRRKEVPITVIPETPESLMPMSARDGGIRRISETPPGNLATELETDDPLKENKPTWKRSKLSRKYASQSKVPTTKKDLTETEPTEKSSMKLGIDLVRGTGTVESHERRDLLPIHAAQDVVSEKDSTLSKRHPPQSGVEKSQQSRSSPANLPSEAGTQPGSRNGNLEDDDILNELLRENKSLFKSSKLSRKARPRLSQQSRPSPRDLISDAGTQFGVMDGTLEDNDIPNELLKPSHKARPPASPKRDQVTAVSAADVNPDSHAGVLNQEVNTQCGSISRDSNKLLAALEGDHDDYIVTTHSDLGVRPVTRNPTMSTSVPPSDSGEVRLSKALGMDDMGLSMGRLSNKIGHQGVRPSTLNPTKSTSVPPIDSRILDKPSGVNDMIPSMGKLAHTAGHQDELCEAGDSSSIAPEESKTGGALDSPSLEDEILSELSRTAQPVRSKSKLSRKPRRQVRPNPVRKSPPANNTEEGSVEIKPTRIMGRKSGTKSSGGSSHKRPPQRGNSPLAKRSQKCDADEADRATSGRKHLFGGDGAVMSSEITPNSAIGSKSPIPGKYRGGVTSPAAPRGPPAPAVDHPAVLSDLTNTHSNRSIDAEWDDLNESLLAALDEEDLLAQAGITPVRTISTNPDGDRTAASNVSQHSPFKRDQEASLPSDLVRFRVKSVEDSGNGAKLLHVQNLSTASTQTCVLSGVWSQLAYREGDVLAIHGQWSSSGHCCVSQDDGFIIYNPDMLLTGTAVSNSIRCMRRSVLNELFKGIDKGNKAMVLGTMVHDVFDKALRTNKFDKDSLVKYATLSVDDAAFRDKLYSMQLKEADVLKDIEEYYKPLQTWANKYLRQSPQSMVDIKWPGSPSSVKTPVSIPRVADIEDNMWCPRWGLKGKVDVTTEVKIKRSPQTQRPDTFTLPLELKTGRQTNSMEHHSQVMLYNLMMTDQESQGPPLGLLLYLKTGALLSVTASHMDKRELVHLRNQLAFYLTRETEVTAEGLLPPELPPPIEDDFTCGRCAHATSCAITNRLRPSGSMSESATAFFAEQINHLSNVHLQYFRHWYALLALEGREVRKKNPTRHVWNKPVQERELKGGCCSNLIVKNSRQESSGKFSITFNQKQRSVPIKFAVGDWVLVSEDGKRTFAKLIGTVTSSSTSSVTISTDSPLPVYPGNKATYTMDTNESYNSMASSYNNLAGLMSSTAHMSGLRSAIVDLDTPTYGNSGRDDLSLSAEAEKILQELNGDQQSAIVKVLQSHDYTLVMGMPGTGKTTTVTALVRILVLEGKTVLLTSYTHSAVDNILLKLDKVGVPFLRLGSSYRIRQDLLKQSEETALKGMGVDEVTTVIESMPVIAATSLGVKSSLLTHRHFDFCIIDEASQISQPVCLAPLFRATKFVLVGDHKQLPPLVQSPQARLHGMDESLFQRLACAHPESVTKLRLQYRMHPLIMDISNQFTYEGALECGNHSEQSKLLKLPGYTGRMDDGWLQMALDPETVVQLFSTEQLHIKDSGSGLNEVEANLVRDTVQQLIQSGCPPTDVGIITPFNKQRRLLQSLVEPLSTDIEVNTVDKYQGRDKSVIIVSFSMQRQSGPSILEDERRINVAITRAKRKLLMFGDCAVLRSTRSVGKLLRVLQEKGLVTVIKEP